MAEYLNAVCKVCGKKYHHCEKCEQIGSWRAVACSPECWNIWVDTVRARKAAEVAAKEPVVETSVIEEAPTITYEDSRPAEDVYDADVSVATEE